MSAGSIEPSHRLKWNTFVLSFRLWGWDRHQWHARFQQLPYRRSRSPTRGLFQHDLCFETLEVELLRLQCLDQTVAALDPSLSSSKHIDLFFQFRNDRRHSLPRANIILDFLGIAVYFDRKC